MVALVSFSSMCIFSGQSAFEGLVYLIPKNQQDFLGSQGDSDWRGPQEVPGPTSSSKERSALRSDQVTQGFTQSGLETSEEGGCTTSQCNPFNARLSLWSKCFSLDPVWISLVSACTPSLILPTGTSVRRAISVWQKFKRLSIQICLYKASPSFIS